MPADKIELRSAGEQFPNDVVQLEQAPIAPIAAPMLKPARLDAYQLSNYDSERFSFGMDNEKTAAILRDMADRIERKDFILQECNILTRAEHDNYQMTFFTLVFHQKKTEK